MNIHASAEDYLERILMLEGRKKHVRSIDIANELHFSRSSVSIAMKQLRENGYIEIDDLGVITLLPKGREIAEKVYKRHIILTDFLTGLGVDKSIAEADACKVEHDLSDETFSALEKYLNNK